MRYFLCCAAIALGACGGVHASLGAPHAPKGPAISAEGAASLPVGPMVEDPREVGARQARDRVIAYLIDVGHAEPHHRELVADRERREREHRLMSDAERAARLEADALQTRARVHAYLVALGAKERPPRPAPLPEEPGDAPVVGSVWGPGRWAWQGGQWVWSAGRWHEPAEADGGSDGTDLALGLLELALSAIGDDDDGGRHRVPDEGRVRDHRRGGGEAIVRDHREGKRDSTPIVRDHRESKRDSTPTVRDHRDRDSKKDDDDRKPVVRDHRR